MLARPFLIGLMALTTLPLSQQQMQRVMPLVDTHALLSVHNLSDDVSLLSVGERWSPNGVHEGMFVSLYGASTGSPDKSPRLVATMDIQAWLLRGDGTAISQIERRDVKVNGIVFTFAPVPAKELAGVVVSVNGTLFVREVKAS